MPALIRRVHRVIIEAGARVVVLGLSASRRDWPALSCCTLSCPMRELVSGSRSEPPIWQSFKKLPKLRASRPNRSCAVPDRQC
jgi:hypothetical protein